MHTFILVNCGSLSNISNGLVSITGIFEGSLATYTCFVGYKIAEHVTRTCQSNAEWSGFTPVCEST